MQSFDFEFEELAIVPGSTFFLLNGLAEAEVDSDCESCALRQVTLRDADHDEELVLERGESDRTKAVLFELIEDALMSKDLLTDEMIRQDDEERAEHGRKPRRRGFYD